MTDIHKPHPLYRNTERKWAEAFIEEGELLFRPLTYFRELEEPRGDKHEGRHIIDAAGTTIEIWDEKIKAYVAPIKIVSGQFTDSLTRPDCCFIKCFSDVPQLEFGPATIEIFDVHGFFAGLRVVFAKQLGVELKFSQVNYYDPIEQASLPEIPTELAFYKRCCFQVQREFRFVFYLNGVTRNMLLETCEKTNPSYSETLKNSLKMRVGNLTEFARIM